MTLFAQRHDTREAAEAEYAALFAAAWPVCSTSGEDYGVGPCAPADIAALAVRVMKELVVHAGGVVAMSTGKFYVDPPSIEIHDSYRE